MHNVVYGNAMENLRGRVDERLVSKKKRYFEMDVKGY